MVSHVFLRLNLYVIIVSKSTTVSISWNLYMYFNTVIHSFCTSHFPTWWICLFSVISCPYQGLLSIPKLTISWSQTQDNFVMIVSLEITNTGLKSYLSIFLNSADWIHVHNFSPRVPFSFPRQLDRKHFVLHDLDI